MTNRVIGANIYSRPLISRADMDILDKALSDWKVDNWYTTTELEWLKRKWYSQNIEQNSRGSIPISSTETFKHTRGIFLKSNNTCIGITRGFFTGDKKYEKILTAFDPDYRGLGHRKEYSSIALKMYFNEYQIDSLTRKLPLRFTDGTSNSAFVTNMARMLHIAETYEPFVEATEVSKEVNTSRGAAIEYSVRTITKAQWQTWIDLAENAAIKNADYTWSWDYT